MIKKLSISLIFALYSSLAFSTTQYIVTKDNINIRIDSTTTSHSLGTLAKGDKLEIVAENFEWYKIKLPKKYTCYITKKFVKKTSNSSVSITGLNVNLREKPSLDSYIVGMVSQGATLELVREGSKWVEVKGNPHIYGWVHKKFLEEFKNPPATTEVSESYCEDCARESAE